MFLMKITIRDIIKLPEFLCADRLELESEYFESVRLKLLLNKYREGQARDPRQVHRVTSFSKLRVSDSI